MKKIMLVLAIFLVVPSVSFAAALTPQQSSSLIAVVQSSPSTPASIFVPFITAFSNITVTQAASLISVVQSAPGVPASAFVNLLTSFTVDTATTQPVTPVIPATTSAATTQSTTPTTISTPPQVIGPAPQFIQTPTLVSTVQTTQYDSSGNITGGHPDYTISWTTNIPATADIRSVHFFTGDYSTIIPSTPSSYQEVLAESNELGTSSTTSYTITTSVQGIFIILNANNQYAIWRGRLDCTPAQPTNCI